MPVSEQTGVPRSRPADRRKTGWSQSLADAVRDGRTLLESLGLPSDAVVANDFPVLVPQSFLARMVPGDLNDPLLRQVLPVDAENRAVPGFTLDAVGDEAAKAAPGMIHKYHGRVLLIAAGACAIHCRYCFRRHYPYGDDPRRLDDWQPAIDAIAADTSIREVILSGGDPLMLTDTRLEDLVGMISAIPHIDRLRFHTRLPIVLPDRVTDRLIDLLTESTGPRSWVVVHANHANEVAGDCEEALKALVAAGVPVLNQAVLLRGVNDTAAAIGDLCERLINLGVQPYYLSLLDRVAGTAHFEVPEAEGLAIVEAVRRRLPGYAVPTLVREIEGEASKTPVR